MRLGFLGALLFALPASALDPFEIQVYDGTANAPGRAGLEVHFNYVPRGLTAAEGPVLPPDKQWHLTFEPSYGVTSFWELGGYLQTSLRPDGTFDYAGAKLRSKFVIPASWDVNLRLGINFELSFLPERYDAGRWGGEVRPIAAWENERVLLAINPNLELSFAGDPVTVEPSAMAKLKLGGFALGVEYYASFGPLRGLSPVSAQQHYLYEAFDLLSLKSVELNLALGEGLNSASNALTFKMIAGYVF